jgi:hypothetical protein
MDGYIKDAVNLWCEDPDGAIRTHQQMGRVPRDEHSRLFFGKNKFKENISCEQRFYYVGYSFTSAFYQPIGRQSAGN